MIDIKEIQLFLEQLGEALEEELEKFYLENRNVLVRSDYKSKDDHKVKEIVKRVLENQKKNLKRIFLIKYYLNKGQYGEAIYPLNLLINDFEKKGIEKEKYLPLKHLEEMLRKNFFVHNV